MLKEEIKHYYVKCLLKTTEGKRRLKNKEQIQQIQQNTKYNKYSWRLVADSFFRH